MTDGQLVPLEGVFLFVIETRCLSAMVYLCLCFIDVELGSSVGFRFHESPTSPVYFAVRIQRRDELDVGCVGFHRTTLTFANSNTCISISFFSSSDNSTHQNICRPATAQSQSICHHETKSSHSHSPRISHRPIR